jgi:hypothetical protein
MFTNAYGQHQDHGLGVCGFWYKTLRFEAGLCRFYAPLGQDHGGRRRFCARKLPFAI